MKAYVRTSSADQHVELQNTSIPEINKDEVLIKVKAFGVGIHDRYFIPSQVIFPYIIGSEGAGIIVKIGNEIKNFKIGDRVIFTTILQPQGGSWAEYATAKVDAMMPLPESLTFAQGAAIPIAGKTALECMNSLNLKSGDTLFIAGASGAIGSLVIQLAFKKGIRISASASEKNHHYMKSLGAELTVDYHDPKWPNEVLKWSDNGVDAALAIQPGTGSESIKTVRDGGLLITVSGDSHTVLPQRAIAIKQMGHSGISQGQMLKLIEDISDNKIQLTIEREYSFSEALSALEKTETRHARGKVVVTID